jgi:hypothetical protein
MLKQHCWILFGNGTDARNNLLFVRLRFLFSRKPTMQGIKSAILPLNYWFAAETAGQCCSEHIKVMSGNDFAPVEFANLLQCLLLAAGLPTVLSPGLITTGVGAMI